MNAGRFLLTLSLLAASAAHIPPPARAARPPQLSGADAQKVTLRSHHKHQDYEKAVVRVEPPAPRKGGARAGLGNHTLRYGGINIDAGNGWIDVPHAHGSRSQIKDLGALDWSEVFDVPFLHASTTPHPGGLRFDFSAGDGSVRVTPENVMAKVEVGHLYLVHFKDDEADFYLMFRVESVKPGDECTLSWKYVPSPEP